MTYGLNRRAVLASAAAAATLLGPALASAEGVLNLYSSRHYDTDERLYSDFEEATGIKIERLDGKADALIEKLKSDGAESPADVFLTVDAGRMWRADQAGLLQPVDSEVLNASIPENLRHPDGHWFGFSKRARVIFYSKDRVEEPPQTYEALADPKYKGKVCTRSGSNIYMLSLMSSVIDAAGEDTAKAWAEGVYANRARDPEGGDTDQLRAIVSGQCDIVVSNTYYFVRALVKEVKGLTGSTDGIGVVFPNQGDRGTHVNVSVGGVLANAPNKENAVKFLEYLASPQAQQYFSAGNSEYPVVEGAEVAPKLAGLGEFTEDDIPLAKLGENQAQAQAIYDAAGYK